MGAADDEEIPHPGQYVLTRIVIQIFLSYARSCVAFVLSCTSTPFLLKVRMGSCSQLDVPKLRRAGLDCYNYLFPLAKKHIVNAPAFEQYCQGIEETF